MTEASGPGLVYMSRKELLDYMSDVLMAARGGELNERDYDLAIIGLGLALTEERDTPRSFEPLHEAAGRATKHIFQNRAHHVYAPLPQSAVGKSGLTTTQEDESFPLAGQACAGGIRPRHPPRCRQLQVTLRTNEETGAEYRRQGVEQRERKRQAVQ
jgi:hypothetical protein